MIDVIRNNTKQNLSTDCTDYTDLIFCEICVICELTEATLVIISDNA